MELTEWIPDRVVTFLQDIGIRVEKTELQEKTFLPGIKIVASTLLVDPSKEGFCPGDILHEAAHIALTSPEDRKKLGGKLNPEEGQEIACHAWCWAAAKHLDLQPEWVFHDQYKAGGDWLIETLSNNGTIGQPLLRYWGLTGENGVDWPEMNQWVRT